MATQSVEPFARPTRNLIPVLLFAAGFAVAACTPGDDDRRDPVAEPTVRAVATSRPTTRPTAPPAVDVYYAKCADARAAGAAPLYRGDPGYRSGLDRDGDGIACE